MLELSLIEVIQGLVVDGHSAFAGWVDRYVFSPGDFLGRGPFIHDPTVAAMYSVTASIAMACIGMALVYASLRSMTERSYHARYSLKVMLPKLALVAALIPLGRPLIAGALDFNTLVAHTVWSQAPVAAQSCLPPSAHVLGPIEPAGVSQDRVWCTFIRDASLGTLLTALLALALTAMLGVLALVGIVRDVMIAVLTVCAPVAFLCMALPETHSYALLWRRLLVTAVFTQSVQVLVLRLAITLSFQNTAISLLHGLVAMYLVLRVPTALHLSAGIESKAMLHLKHAEHGLEAALFPHPSHARTRAHPAAD